MKKLENKIINKFYVLEAKRTASEIVLRVVTIVLFAGVGGFFLGQLWYQYQTQQTLDVLQLFTQDWEIIRLYFGDVVATIYGETPPEDFIISLVSIILFILAVLTSARSYSKIKNRIKAVAAYWKKPI